MRNTAIQMLLMELSVVAVASGLTLAEADIQSRSVADWRTKDWAPAKHTPTVFAFGQ